MVIACLGWGSLVWNSDTLPLKSTWFENGPFLPIEFARQSADGRITLVIVNNGNISLVQSLWAMLDLETIDDAIEALRKREGILIENVIKHIGFWIEGQKPNDEGITLTISNWAKQLELNAVIWTNLPPKFANKNGYVPSMEEVVNYLSSLEADKLNRAKEYIQKTPQQIDTNYRREIKAKLNWA